MNRAFGVAYDRVDIELLMKLATPDHQADCREGEHKTGWLWYCCSRFLQW